MAPGETPRLSIRHPVIARLPRQSMSIAPDAGIKGADFRRDAFAD